MEYGIRSSQFGVLDCKTNCRPFVELNCKLWARFECECECECEWGIRISWQTNCAHLSTVTGAKGPSRPLGEYLNMAIEVNFLFQCCCFRILTQRIRNLSTHLGINTRAEPVMLLLADMQWWICYIPTVSVRLLLTESPWMFQQLQWL